VSEKQDKIENRNNLFENVLSGFKKTGDVLSPKKISINTQQNVP